MAPIASAPPSVKSSPKPTQKASSCLIRGSVPSLVVSEGMSKPDAASTGGDGEEDNDTRDENVTPRLAIEADDASDSNDSLDEESINDDQQNVQKSSQQRSSFKDPFPSLSPMPSRSSLESGYNRNRAPPQPSWVAPPLKPAAHNNISPQKRSSGSYTPPSAMYAAQTPSISRANTPLSVQTTPIKSESAYNNPQKSWIDPFPTPDASVHSRYGTLTPCSSRVSGGNNDLDGDKSEKVLDADDWDTILETVPKIPLIEELHISDQERARNDVINKSCPRLQSMGVEEMPVRHVASETNLPLMKRPSLEDIWGALKSGPDGNELGTEYNKQMEGMWKKIEDKKKTEKRVNRSEQLKYGEQPLQPRAKEHTFHRSSTAPVEASWEGLRKRPMKNTDNTINSNLANNSSTITNVTGADLANEVKMIIWQREGGSPKGPLTPNRLSLRALRASSSRALATARDSAGELVFSPVKTVHRAYQTNSQRAAKLVRNTRQKLKERKEQRRQRRLARMKEPPRSWWIVVPADHPYKIAWDVMTMLWALLGAYRTHVRIRDRVFDQSPLILLTEVWFTVDILLNFVTEHKTRKGEVIRDGKAIWARYLTTWFLIDILSLIPWERIYVRPVVEKIKRRNIFQKTFFRSKAVVRVSRVLRGRHIRLFGKVSKQTGTPLRQLVALVIKYLPKYLVFLRNMKGALVVRALRFVHWLHNMYKKIWVKAKNARRTLVARRKMGHSLFSPIRTSEDGNDLESDDDDDESEQDSDSDDQDDDDEGGVDSDSDDDDENEGMMVSVNKRDSEFTGFHRAYSEGSPVFEPRRRSFSQNEVLGRNLDESRD